jgi:3-deoxy-manno-octulosonate cytidylyltransferase (CMP-KDO synthetase)
MIKKVLGVLPARMASERAPGKLARKIKGKPVLQHTYDRAKKAKTLDEVVIAADDTRQMHDVASSFCPAVYRTPSKIRNGTIRVNHTVENNIELNQYNIIVNVQSDEVNIPPLLIDDMVNLFIQAAELDLVLAVIQREPGFRPSPNSTVQAIFGEDGFLRDLIRLQTDEPTKEVIYEHLGVAVWDREALTKYCAEQEDPRCALRNNEYMGVIDGPYKAAVVLFTDHNPIAINTEADFDRASIDLLG